mmetsp:Transcript_20662/g.50021  ORF Transcript_20662/g.50021 Transcript_20662/m.50021 type:complete len:109 (+) Transcript_20662:561-887(+)
MGIGDDFLPLSGIKVFWGCLLATCFRSSQTDLTRMEAVVEESGLDYLLVRPMGIDPSEKPTGSFQLIKKSGEGGLPMTVSKEDVADFMLDEALLPTLHQAAVTIGKKV